MPKIAHISISRLFNTGNFEHTKISVSMETEPGDKPGTLLRTLENLLGDLDPKCPFDSDRIKYAMRTLSLPESEDDDDFERESREEARNTMAGLNEWTANRQQAFDTLDAIHADTWIEESENRQSI